MSNSHLVTLANYNLWANEQICHFINSAGEENVDKETESSFPTIRKTLYHMWDAQVVWYKRLNGESINSWPSHNFSGTLQEAIDSFLTNSKEFIDFTNRLIDEKHQAKIEYKSIDGTSYFNTTEEILMHIMNHSTYHRGQLISMLRFVGCTNLGSTDMIRYFRK